MLSDDQIKWAASQLDDYIIKTAGIRFHEEFAKLGVKIEDIVGVFRSAPLDTAKLYRTASTEGTGTTTTVAETADTEGVVNDYIPSTETITIFNRKPGAPPYVRCLQHYKTAIEVNKQQFRSGLPLYCPGRWRYLRITSP